MGPTYTRIRFGSAYRVELALYREALTMARHLRHAHLNHLAAQWLSRAADSRREALSMHRTERTRVAELTWRAAADACRPVRCY
jgi:hypothetical protein